MPECGGRFGPKEGRPAPAPDSPHSAFLMAQAESQPTALLNTGHRIPLFGLGTFKADEKTTNEAVAAALQAGYRHIDCAQHYLNEPAIGHGLKGALDAGHAKREEVFVTSKLW